MKPLTDKQLDHLLDLWTAPATPESLRERVFARPPWWNRLLGGLLSLNNPISKIRLLRKKKGRYKAV